MVDDILAIPDHVRDALWRVESARIEPAAAAGVLVCGMGGSAIGGDLAAGVLADRLGGPLQTIRGYALPAWATADWTVLCSSYSGDTEETLACFEAAGELGSRRIVASTGGTLVDAARAAELPVIGLPGILPAPRTGVAYMLVCAAEVAALAGIAPAIHDELEEAAAFLADRAKGLRSRAAEIVAQLEGSAPVIYGAGLTAPVARRWKTQVNENAKQPAFFSELPEANHNEICGWKGDAPGGPFSGVLLGDAGQHPRERLRFDLTEAAITAAGATAVRLETEGESPAARLLWGVMLGDLVSLGLAEARGVDPLPIEAIDRLKAGLARS